jgi:hypothetical protein
VPLPPVPAEPAAAAALDVDDVVDDREAFLHGLASMPSRFKSKAARTILPGAGNRTASKASEGKARTSTTESTAGSAVLGKHFSPPTEGAASESFFRAAAVAAAGSREAASRSSPLTPTFSPEALKGAVGFSQVLLLLLPMVGDCQASGPVVVRVA